jgi:hypothetical protein
MAYGAAPDRRQAVNPATLTTLAGYLHAVFGGFAAIMTSGALALFYVGIVVSMCFILFAIGRALHQGGGAVFETIGFRVLIVTALTAFVVGFQAFGAIVRSDVTKYAARLAGTNPYVTGDFTPAGILASNDALIQALYASGNFLPLPTLAFMHMDKFFAIIFVQIGSGILALDLFLANLSMDIIFGVCAFLIGLIMNPWLASFTSDLFKLIISTAVFVISIGAFVSVGQALAGLELGYINGLGPKTALAGPDFSAVGTACFLYAIIATIVPFYLASRIGGNPLLQLGGILASVRSGKAAVGL